jgi:hypothetical protein
MELLGDQSTPVLAYSTHGRVMIDEIGDSGQLERRLIDWETERSRDWEAKGLTI